MRGLRIAARLCRVCAGLWVFGAASIVVAVLRDTAHTGILQDRSGSGGAGYATFGVALMLGLALFFAIAYWAAGHFVRRRRPVGGWIGFGVAGLHACVALLLLYFWITTWPEHPVPANIAWSGLILALNLAVLGLLAFNWRDLDRGRPDDGRDETFGGPRP